MSENQVTPKATPSKMEEQDIILVDIETVDKLSDSAPDYFVVSDILTPEGYVRDKPRHIIFRGSVEAVITKHNQSVVLEGSFPKNQSTSNIDAQPPSKNIEVSIPDIKKQATLVLEDIDSNTITPETKGLIEGLLRAVETLQGNISNLADQILEYRAKAEAESNSHNELMRIYVDTRKSFEKDRNSWKSEKEQLIADCKMQVSIAERVARLPYVLKEIPPLDMTSEMASVILENLTSFADTSSSSPQVKKTNVNDSYEYDFATGHDDEEDTVGAGWGEDESYTV